MKHVSPQYHIVFDQQFTSTGIPENKTPENWDNLFQHECWQANFDSNHDNTTTKLELDSTTLLQDRDSHLVASNRGRKK